MQTIHSINLWIHIAFGTAGLLLGLVVLNAPKRKGLHTRFGRYFLSTLAVVVLTGLLGALFFRSTPFLMLLTLLSGYEGYSGFRAVRLRRQKAGRQDVIIAVIVLITGLVYTARLNLGAGNWSPSVIYPTVGSLVFLTGYDLVKRFLWFERLRGFWLYEHIYKLISAFGALLSAFCGNVFPAWQPYSQMVPGLFCLLMIAYFFRKVSARTFHSSSSVPANTVVPASRYQ
ncbi:hypothetical protein [Larkinella soli]|uniref:hypothetical protein n=1 Tax=Larkinella soli TaxID=1770527 RepID=UPI000FFC2B01|nr:hypothetical protein [Larkinella soli]